MEEKEVNNRWSQYGPRTVTLGTKSNGTCKACQKAKCHCEFEAGASACTKCVKAGKSDGCVPQDSCTQ
jgi:hypothetical protein